MERKDCCFSCTQSQKLLTVTAWDIQNGMPLCTYSCDAGYSGSSARPTAVCLLKDSHLLCAPSNLPFIYVWNLNKEQVMLKIACTGLVRSLSCTPDGVYCAAAIGEKIHIWHVCTGNLCAIVSQHYQPINVIRFSDDRVHLVSGGEDSRVIVWRLNSVLTEGRRRGRHSSRAPPPSSASPSSSLTRHVWSDHSLPVMDLQCGHGGLQSRVVTVSLDQTCKVYEITSGVLLCSILLDFGLVSVTLDLAEQWIFVGAGNGKIHQIDLQSKVLGCRALKDSSKLFYSGHGKAITGLGVASWANVLVSSSTSEDVARVWDIPSCQVLREVKMKGFVSTMLLTGGLTSLGKQKRASDAVQPLKIPTPVVKPFKKQFRSSSKSPERDGKSQSSLTMPIHLSGMDPLCDLAELQYLEPVHHTTIPDNSDVSEKDLCLEAAQRDLQELKEVHKTMYSFIMDKLIPQT